MSAAKKEDRGQKPEGQRQLSNREDAKIAKTFFTFRMKIELLDVLGALSEAGGSRSD